MDKVSNHIIFNKRVAEYARDKALYRPIMALKGMKSMWTKRPHLPQAQRKGFPSLLDIKPGRSRGRKSYLKEN